MALITDSETVLLVNLERTGKEYREALTVLRLAAELHGHGNRVPRFKMALRRYALARKLYKQALREFSEYYL
jgi:hypothetical protein